jgi:hypothetical protein
MLGVNTDATCNDEQSAKRRAHNVRSQNPVDKGHRAWSRGHRILTSSRDAQQRGGACYLN